MRTLVEAPPVQKQSTLRAPALLLAIVAIGWLALVIAAPPAGEPDLARMLLFIGVFFAAPVIAIAWIVLVILRLLLRQPIGFWGWLVVPCVLVLAWWAPWSDWQFRRAFNASRPTLMAVVAEFDGLASGETVSVRRFVGSFQIERVTKYSGGTIVTMAAGPDGEMGLVYSPSGQLPTPPSWALTHHCTLIEGDWWRYGWGDE